MGLTLTESLDVDKLKHLEHAEDHIFHGGHEGVKHAIDTLDDVHNALSGNNTDTKITTKYDGSPSVVFGKHPETKKFFVASKSAFNKNPKINYTHADIEQNHGHAPGLVTKLKSALDNLPKVAPKTGVYQGDFMYDRADVFKEGDHLKFAPNTIVYGAHKDSDQGKKIAKSKMGFVVHTKYSGTKLDDMKAGFNVDHHNFNHHPDVNLVNPEISANHNYTPEMKREYNQHRNRALKMYASISSDVIDSLAKHSEHIKPYINSTVRDGTTPTAEGYQKHLETRHNMETAKVKTDAAKSSKAQKYNELINHVSANKTEFKKVFALHSHIQKAKDTLVNALGNPTEFSHTVGGQEVKPEGFVAIKNGRPTKLVDRAEFSKLNFANNRGKREQDSLHEEVEAEAPEKQHVFTFGRMNPPTIGHGVLIDKVKEVAKAKNADHTVVLSHTQNGKKNPLSIEQKMKHAQRMFPGTNFVAASKEAPTLLQHAKNFHNQGVTHLTMVAGADRVEEFRHLLGKYNGPDKEFNFKHVDVVSAGERDPDADDVTGMSASKLRGHVEAGNYDEFKKGIPSHVSDKHAKELFNDVKEGMKGQPKKLKEETKQILEAIATTIQRATGRVRMRRFRARIDTMRDIKLSRTASLDVLKVRARRDARNQFKNKLASIRGKKGGYYTLPYSSRMAIDTMLKGRQKLIKQAALRMIPKLRKMDMARTHVKEENSKERIDKKQLNRKLKFYFAIFDI